MALLGFGESTTESKHLANADKRVLLTPDTLLSGFPYIFDTLQLRIASLNH